VCGSSLFWGPLERNWIGVAMGAFDRPTGTKLRIHIYVADEGDYYDIADGLPPNSSDLAVPNGQCVGRRGIEMSRAGT